MAGRSVSGGRLSLVNLGNSAADVQYSFASMSGKPGVVTPTVAVSGPAPAGAYSARLVLGMEYGSEIMAVSGQTITLDGVPATTDDSGEVVFPLGQRSRLGSLVLDPSMELDDGRYVLVAQMLRDGAALTTPYAAPLLVGDVTAGSGPAPETPVDPARPTPPAGTSPTHGTPQPDPGVPTPGTGTPPDGPQPGNDAPAGHEPDAGTQPQPGGDVPDTPAPSTPAPGTPGPTTPDPGTPGTPGTPDPAASAPSAPTPSAPTPEVPTPEVPAPSDPDVPSPGQPGNPIDSTPDPQDGDGAQQPGAPDPDLGGEKHYPEVGPFELTSVSPTRVTAAGGTRVTVTGLSIPDGARVRIGATTPAPTTVVSSTQLYFTTPSLVPGTYDLYVFGPDGSFSTLAAGLTFVDVDAGADGPGDAPTPGDTPAPEDTPAPGDSTGRGLPPDPAEGQEPDRTPEKVVEGPNGRRLVSSALFNSIPRSIWNLNCSAACGGLPV